MRDRVFIDTNLFVYAHITDDARKNKIAAGLLKSGISGSRIIISTQVLSEFYSAMSKYKRSHDEIAEFLSDIIRCANVASVSLTTVELCLKLKDKYGYSYWDSLILASAAENECETIYSEDMRHGHIIEGDLNIYNPFV